MGGPETTLRRVQADDCPLLASIHKAAFGAQAWDADGFARLMQRPGAVGLIAGEQALLIADIIAGEAEILTIATHPQARRGGLALLLLQALLRPDEVTRCVLEVCSSNDAACALYKKAGFVYAGLRKDYYTGAGRKFDAYVLEYCKSRKF